MSEMQHPPNAYEVIVGVAREPFGGAERSREMAIAEALRYLSYADQTDTVGYHGDLIGVTVHGDDGRQDFGIGVEISVPYSREQQLADFEEEMDVLSRVESCEEIAYQPID